ncbi:MAG TPA: multicopper oxidase domain-containing protein [bacterium]|nr:multicopper oxidase domain-containing protein [bacterium]
MLMSIVKCFVRRCAPVAALAALAALLVAPGAPTAAAQNGENGFYDAALPAVGNQHVKQITVVARDTVQEIAPGVKVPLWTFNGSVPAPLIHVRQGDEVRVAFVNKTPMAHSVDFHAATTPWNVWYQPVAPGKTLNFSFVAKDPGVFMFHCGTPPAFMHISSGMYGAVIVDPKTPLPPAKEFALIESEFYVRPGPNNTYQPDAQKVLDVKPDYVVFNGIADQYQEHPLVVRAGQRIRLYVLNAGPTLFSAFHVIGWIFNKVYVDGNPANVLRGVQTYAIPPGGGAMFELTIDQPGLYPFVTHAFAYTSRGAVGVIKVLPAK